MARAVAAARFRPGGSLSATTSTRVFLHSVAGCALYVVGAIVVTMAANVPLNDALMNVDPAGADAAERWSGYVSDWTRWNHARAATAIAASGLLVAALRVSP